MEVTQVKRFKSIDVLRGFAVLSMIFAHTVAFFAISEGGAAKGSFVYLFGEFGGMVSFTLFLFLSGVSIYLSFFSKLGKDFSKETINRSRKKILLRGFKFLIAYYLLAFGSVLATTSILGFPPSYDWVEVIFKILTFGIIPGFVEFLIPFFLFQLIVVFGYRQLNLLIASPLVGFSISVVLYIVGVALSGVYVGEFFLESFKSILVGSQIQGAFNTFPVLQYFIVYFAGILFGRTISQANFRLFKNRLLTLFVLLSSSALGSLIIINNYINNPFISLNQYDGRFPPGLGFMVLSFTLAILVISIYLIFEKFIPSLIKATLMSIGTEAFGFLLFHTITIFILVFLYKNSSAIISPTSQPTDIFMIYIFILIITWVSNSVKNSYKKSIFEQFGQEILWFFNPKILQNIIIVTVVAIFGLALFNSSPNISVNAQEYVIKKKLISETEGPAWWDNSYKGFYQLEISASNFNFPLQRGSWVGVRIDHINLLNNGLSLKSSGEDVVVVKFNSGNGEFAILPAIYEGQSSASFDIFFKLTNSVDISDETYFVYFGNEFPQIRPLSEDRYLNRPDVTKVRLSERFINEVQTSVNKRWHIKTKPRAFQSASLQFEAKVPQSLLSPNTVVSYTVSGTNLTGRMQKFSEGDYRANIVVNDLVPGVYTIYANVFNVDSGFNVYKSFASPFFVSYPIYVAWTMDWEGWDVAQGDLDEISNIADTYNMPITHFFNPRIYVKNQFTINSISEERAQFLTRWVSDRQRINFEEIGMHIHMWADMVIEAGVSSRNQFIVGTYGVDVPTYVYSEEELVKVFQWGRSKLAEYGLGAPISYRTGAWMSGVNVLNAAQKAGFIIDSSGRTGGPVNPSIPSSTRVPWNLSTNTRPYRPNNSDINSWAGPLSERMKIWEYPNNGADSYWFSAGELISRFNDNYTNKGEIMYKPQVVNYLSHPHWFISMDRWKIRGLLDYTNQFLASRDAGPVVYETLERIHADWNQEKYYNGD